MSDDILHDAHFVDYVLDRTRHHLRKEGSTQLVVWSDGCAAQYRSKLPFFYSSKSREVERAYFGSRHGKGPCDACGGVIKTAVNLDVLGGEVIVQNAQEMFDHLSQNYVLLDSTVPAATCCHKKRSFEVVKTEQIDRTLPSSALLTVPGTTADPPCSRQG